ncbi:MAG: hypothetical protein IJT54_07400 [Candidatus Methanomethylophilaceae archaeon]|nr:hypothetical protein [Candidatus Methanomethylophilaceae archaeon]
MDGTERITVRLPTDSIILLKSLVDDGTYHDISEAVRDAVDALIKKNMTVEEMIAARSRTTLDGNALEGLTSTDTEVDDAIKDAVRVYLERRTE